MSKRKSFNKNVQFKEEYREELKDELNKRDKLKYKYEGDLIFHAVMAFGQSSNITTPYILEDTCREKCLLKSDRYYLCSRGGKFKGEKNIVKVPYIFRDGKKPMSINGVRKICKKCYNFNKGLEEDEYKKVLKNDRLFCFQKKLVKTQEGYGFVCLRGGPTNDALLNHITLDNPYWFMIDGEKMPLDLVIRICNSACIFSGLYVL